MYVRLSLVPLLVGAVVRPCVCPFPCVPVTWQSHQLNGSTQYHWVMIHCIWDVRSVAIESILNCLLRAGTPMRYAPTVIALLFLS